MPRPSVLVVDPESVRRKEISNGLTGFGYEVIPTVGLAEGRRFAATLGPGVVVAAGRADEGWGRRGLRALRRQWPRRRADAAVARQDGGGGAGPAGGRALPGGGRPAGGGSGPAHPSRPPRAGDRRRAGLGHRIAGGGFRAAAVPRAGAGGGPGARHRADRLRERGGHVRRRRGDRGFGGAGARHQGVPAAQPARRGAVLALAPPAGRRRAGDPAGGQGAGLPGPGGPGPRRAGPADPRPRAARPRLLRGPLQSAPAGAARRCCRAAGRSAGCSTPCPAPRTGRSCAT